MTRNAPTISCGPDDRQELERLDGSRIESQRRIERAQLIPGCLARQRVKEIPPAGRTRPDTVIQWRQPFGERGWTGWHGVWRAAIPFKAVPLVLALLCWGWGGAPVRGATLDIFPPAAEGSTTSISLGEKVGFSSSDPYDDTNDPVDDYPYMVTVDNDALSLLYKNNTQYHQFTKAGNYAWTARNSYGTVYSSGSVQVNAAPPVIDQLAPDSAWAGGPAFSLTVYGSGFDSGSALSFGSDLIFGVTVSSDGTQLVAGIPASDIQSDGGFAVRVRNSAGDLSLAETFTVFAPQPAPSVSGVCPYFNGAEQCGSQIVGANDPQFLQIDGYNFAVGLQKAKVSLVDAQGQTHPVSGSDTSVIGASTIRVRATLGNDAQLWHAEVTNPDLQSSSGTFQVNAPVPGIESLSPGSAPLNKASGLVLNVLGRTFESTSQVSWNGGAKTTTPMTSSGLTIGLAIQLTSADLSPAGNIPVVVTSPGPGGGQDTMCFTVNSPVLGVDVSDNNVSVDWYAMASAAHGDKRFAYVKVSQGVGPRCGPYSVCETYIDQAASAGLLVGVFHFASIFGVGADIYCPGNFSLSIEEDAKAEAAHFLKVASAHLGTGFLPPMLDVDHDAVGYGLSDGHALSTWIRTWMDVVEGAALGITPTLYVNRSTLAFLDADLQGGAYPLWIVTQDQTDPFTTPAYQVWSWPNWTFQQYWFAAKVSDLSGAFDLDSYASDINELNSLAGVTPLLPKPKIDVGIPTGWSSPRLIVTLSCKNPGASIYYSLDGSPPQTLYTGAITVPPTGFTIQAQAIEAGYNDSDIAAEHVTFWPGQTAVPTYDPDPHFRLSLYGRAGSAVVVQASPDLTNWTTTSDPLVLSLVSNTILGLANFSEELPAGQTMRFYRAVPFVTNQSYVVSLSPGQNYIANQLNRADNGFGDLFPSPGGIRNGDEIWKLGSTGQYSRWVFDSGSPTGFSDGTGQPTPAGTLVPGEGAIYYNTHGATSVEFSGVPNLGVLPAELPCGCGAMNLLSRQTNAWGSYQSLTGLDPTEGAQVYQWLSPSDGTNFLMAFTYTAGAWQPGNPPPIPVGGSALVLVPCTRPPLITHQPTAILAAGGATATFRVTSTGAGPLVYQWSKDGTVLPGATTAELTVPAAEASDLGAYSVTIVNPFGSATSSAAQLQISAPCIPPPADLVSWFTAENATTDLVTGVAAGIGGRIGFTNGVVGKAFWFDGTGGFLSQQMPVDLQPEGTVEFWVKLDRLGPAGQTNQITFWSVGRGSDYLRLGLSVEGTNSAELRFEVRDQWMRSGAPPVPHTWYHVAATWSPSACFLYVNGQLVDSNFIPGAVLIGAAFPLIGRSLSPGAPLSGAMDEISLYDRALTASEILALYAAGSGGKCRP